MFVVLLLLIVVPLVELYVAILVGHAIGALNTIGLLVLLSIFGAWLTKREGLGVIARVREQLDARQMPTNPLVDGALLVIAGLLLLVPGFVTDAIALLLLFPLTRAAVRGTVKRRFRGHITYLGTGSTGPTGRIDGPDDVIDV